MLQDGAPHPPLRGTFSPHAGRRVGNAPRAPLLRRMAKDITTRAELIDALRVATELEHGLMAQYLFAVYSMKRYTYELDPVPLERVRRWSSSITLIARQEMEHLGLALN